MPIEASSAAETYKLMLPVLSRLIPEAEIRFKSELVYEINRKKKEIGAIIIGHNYMEPALYTTVCDIVGDSLEISRKAKEATSNIIVLCGVRFMAETAKILNPTKTVLLPAKKAGCSLASSISAKQVRDLKTMFPGLPVIGYVNTFADVKAECDVCCTSGNAKRVVESFGDQAVIFLPDEYLSKNVAKETDREIFEASEEGAKLYHSRIATKPALIFWKGRCEVHEQFTVEDIQRVRKQFPDVAVLSHPECSPEVVAASDISASSSKMIEFVKKSSAKQFLMLTECSMGDNIMAENPEKDMLRMCSIRCPHMNEITLEDTLDALTNMRQVIEIPETVRAGAERALQRMLEIPPS
jgi:quinolinate synthase